MHPIGKPQNIATDAARHLAAYIEMITAERGVAANTVDGYTRDLEDFLTHLDAQKT